jgi:hypothetical protein
MRRALAWLVSVPLMVAATVSAHALAYLIEVPDPQARAALLSATGHGYGDWIPLTLAVLGAAALVGLTGGIRQLPPTAACGGDPCRD